MLKPTNYDSLKIEDYTPIKLGGHYLKIIDVTESESKSGNPLIIVRFDFSENDEQAGLFHTRFNNDTRPEPRWPSQATSYIVPVDDNNECSRAFKLLVTAVEKSNPGFKVEWSEGPDFVKQFSGKHVGGVFGNVEEEYNGDIFTRRKLRWYCSCSAVKDAVIPKDKVLKKSTPLSFGTFTELDGDMSDVNPF